MNFLDIQIASKSCQLPAQNQFQIWVDAVLKAGPEDSEVVIRIVDEDEMSEFNEHYRKKKGPTNILSFPYQTPEHVVSHLLGDLLVCAPVVEKESQRQKKNLDHHWAHIIIHGMLHLLGYDHISNIEAEEMEALEIKILETLKINNPYQEKIKT